MSVIRSTGPVFAREGVWRLVRVLLGLVWFSLVGRFGIAQELTVPGLLGEYSSAQKVVSRTDTQLQFHWGSGTPDPRLPTGDFSARWTGTLIVPAPGRYRFPVWASGDVQFTIEGSEAVSGSTPEAGWVVGEWINLSGDDVSVELRFRKSNPQAIVRVFWEGPGFEMEPLPQRSIEHTIPADVIDSGFEIPRVHTNFQRGIELIAALRCANCHEIPGAERSVPAPSFQRIADGLKLDWIEEHLAKNSLPVSPSGLSQREMVSGGRLMPGFDFDRQQASDLAHYLLNQSRSQFEAVAMPNPTEERLLAGRRLVESVGCLACHTLGRSTEEVIGTASLWSGGSLESVGAKRSYSWLVRWLVDPNSLNVDHQMPIVPLEQAEREDIALFLASRRTGRTGNAEADSANSTDQAKPTSTATKEELARGKQLFHAARCDACHQRSDVAKIGNQVETDDAGSPKNEDGFPSARRQWTPTRWQSENRCVSKLNEEPSLKRNPLQPRYHLSSEDFAALDAVLSSPGDANREPTGELLIQRKGCLNCHERDQAGGIKRVVGKLLEAEAMWRTKSEGLIPPDLTAVGDKLRDEYLSRAVAGEQPRRLPWLAIRMPRFQHTPEETSLLVDYLIQHDRIPPIVNDPRLKPDSVPPANTPPARDELLRVGNALGGARGFSCVSCHQVAKHIPRGVAMSTRGSDLYRIDQRMRPEFFARWVKAPIRIIPNMEMPGFQRPAPGVLHENLEWQLQAVWTALSFPDKPPVFDTSSVEQVLSSHPDHTPAVVRDVFNIGDPLKSQFVIRSFAMGFSNEVNLLFDVDAMALRGWWSGPFARQRASGKSWFWEPAGIGFQVLGEVAGEPISDISLQPFLNNAPANLKNENNENSAKQSVRVLPTRIHGRVGRLLDYRTEPNRVVLNYVINFSIAERPIELRVRDSWSELSEQAELMPEQGNQDAAPQMLTWSRQLEVSGVPLQYQVILNHKQQSASGTVETVEKPFGIKPNPKIDDRDRVEDVSQEGFVHRVSVKGTLPRSSVAKSSNASQHVNPTQSIKTTAPLVTVDAVPGYSGVKLPLPPAIMPTAITFLDDGTLAFCTLKGQVYLARDLDGDTIPETLVLVEEGLAAPFGLIADGQDLIVAHKPEVLRLRDFNGDGRADSKQVVADGWGYTEDYHDWTCGIIRDSHGRLYIGLGSDYAIAGRNSDQGRLRGKVLRIEPDGKLTPLGHEFRYPTGLAITSDDQIFVSDNQGVQNPFNEINHLVPNGRYGVPSLYEEPFSGPRRDPSLFVPHPWTRSVNGITFLRHPQNEPFMLQGIGCEYDTRFLVRFSIERVGDTYQGAIYPFSIPSPTMLKGGARELVEDVPAPGQRVNRGFLGALCCAEGPDGAIWIGSIHDSGWNGGANIGEIVRLKRSELLPQGIESIQMRQGRVLVRFTQPLDPADAEKPDHWTISGWTRKWTSGYATPDKNQHRLVVERATVSADRRTVTLHVTGQQIGNVYEIRCAIPTKDGEPSLWPSFGYYSLHQFPSD